MQDKPVLAFRKERFQLPSQCQFQVIIEKKYIIEFCKWIEHDKDWVSTYTKCSAPDSTVGAVHENVMLLVGESSQPAMVSFVVAQDDSDISWPGNDRKWPRLKRLPYFRAWRTNPVKGSVPDIVTEKKDKSYFSGLN